MRLLHDESKDIAGLLSQLPAEVAIEDMAKQIVIVSTEHGVWGICMSTELTGLKWGNGQGPACSTYRFASLHVVLSKPLWHHAYRALEHSWSLLCVFASIAQTMQGLPPRQDMRSETLMPGSMFGMGYAPGAAGKASMSMMMGMPGSTTFAGFPGSQQMPPGADGVVALHIAQPPGMRGSWGAPGYNNA